MTRLAAWVSPRSAAVYPDLGAVAGSGLEQVAGALLTIVLVVSVLIMLVCAAAWGIAASHGGVQGAARAKAGLWVCVAVAALTGGAVAWLNFLISLGSRL
jgi:hypothetical protein